MKSNKDKRFNYSVTDANQSFFYVMIISNNKYMASTRIDNTLIFCKVMVEDKELVESLINELGY